VQEASPGNVKGKAYGSQLKGEAAHWTAVFLTV